MKQLDSIASQTDTKRAMEMLQCFRNRYRANGWIIPPEYCEVKAQVEFNYTYRTPLLSVTTWPELFSDMNNTGSPFKQIHYKGFTISSYCECHSCDTFRFNTVTPTELVKQCIADNMIIVSHDSIHFKVIEYFEEYHVYAVYNQIIGSRLLAIMPKGE